MGEIIINGVDVSGCSAHCTNMLGKENYCMAAGIETDEYCEYNPNCLYKQLQRKIAECERLKTNWQEMFERRNKLNSKVLELNNKLQIATEALKEIRSYPSNFCRYKCSFKEEEICLVEDCILDGIAIEIEKIINQALERIKE